MKDSGSLKVYSILVQLVTKCTQGRWTVLKVVMLTKGVAILKINRRGEV